MNKCINIFIKSSLIFKAVFVKDFSTQNCFLCMIKNWKESLNQGDRYGPLLTHLSKAFNFIVYDLLIANLQVNGFYSDS